MICTFDAQADRKGVHMWLGLSLAFLFISSALLLYFRVGFAHGSSVIIEEHLYASNPVHEKGSVVPEEKAKALATPSTQPTQTDILVTGDAADQIEAEMLINLFHKGGAGFIGTHTCLELLLKGYSVVVIDSFNNSREEALLRVKQMAGSKGQNLRYYVFNLRYL